MIYQWICICFLALTGTVQGIAMDQISKIKNNHITKWIRLLSWTGLSLVTGSINVLVNNQFSTISLRNLIQYSVSIVLCQLFYEDKFWKKLTATVLTIFAFSTSELLFLIAFLFENISLDMFMDFTTPTTTFIIGIAALFSCISMQIVVFIWRKVFKEGQTMKYSLYFAVYFFYKLIGMVYLQMAIWENSNIQYYSMNMLLVFICTLALLVIIFSQAERELVERKLSIVKMTRELEKNHYQEIEKKREEIAEITKGNKSMLLAVKNLLDKDVIESAREELQSFLKRVDETKEYPYCSVPIVNAVLTDKQKICDKENIKSHYNIHLSELTAMNQIDLCSIFANLMDNAIRAVKEVDKEERCIDLSAGVTGEYFIVKCRNSVARDPGEKPEGTGYGLKILRGIAKRYHGDMRITCKDLTFEVQLTLNIRKEQEG